jgi:hypothetical protein
VLSRSLHKTNSTLQNVLCTAVHGRGPSLLPESHTVLRHTRRRHFIQTRKKSTAFPAWIFTQPTNVRQHYVQICCAEFRYDRTANVQTADYTTHARKQSMAFKAPCNWPHYVEISYTEFHPKAANIQRPDVYRSIYAFNQTVPVPQSTERLLDFLKTLPAPNFMKI